MSEFRQDPISGEWVIIAPGRARRPHDLLPKRQKRKISPKSSCPFEDLDKSGNKPVLAAYPNEKDWRAVVIPNKYPALTHSHVCAAVLRENLYHVAQGVGHHELLVGRDHAKNLADLPLGESFEILRLLQARYRALGKDDCLTYVSSFFNWGASAGASLTHPHMQLLSLPILPPDVEHSLRGSAEYWGAHKSCAHCDALKYEKKYKKRVVAENAHALALAPFASRAPFEIRIYPKRHEPFFERTGEAALRGTLEVLREVMLMIRRRLNDPDLNFFIHTAPLKDQARYSHYHWHIEVLPKISIPAGFEFSTGIQIDVVDPERAAAILKGKAR